MGKPMFRKVASVREGRLLGRTPMTTQRAETRNRALRRNSTMSVDERQSPTSDERLSPTFEHHDLTDIRFLQKALLEDRPSPEPPRLASSGRITPTSQRGAKGEAKPSKMGRREDTETLAPGSPKKASKAAKHSSELRSSVLQQLSKSMMHMEEGKTPMSGASSTSGDTPPCSPVKPLAAQQRAPRTSGSRLEDLLFSSGLCNSQPHLQQQHQQWQHQQSQHQGQSRSSDTAKVDNLLLDGRPTLLRHAWEQGPRLSRRSSPITSSSTHPVHISPSPSQSSGSGGNNTSSIGPGKPPLPRLSIIDQNSFLPHMEPGSRRPRRHSLTSSLILSKSSLPARTSASGRLSIPAAATLSKSASFTSRVHDAPSGSTGNGTVGREGPLLSTRGGGGLKPTGTKPAADGAPSRLGLLSSVQPGSH
ncbi:hypothetical protein DUNSADRAFT_10836 [Dunaliella salina]|nr:hypothetical protein DUNSADRAFT_10836 [Dunaliella salina]|eukprot:KAF5843662.1 hypothetical protein DUNSADRAFT_10836 [Dunaliella salina]